MKTILSALALSTLVSCFHKDGTPYTGPEIYKLTREGALASCVVFEAVASVSIPIEGMSLAPAVARACCVVIRAFPESIGVVATSDGQAQPIGRFSSGGSNEQDE